MDDYEEMWRKNVTATTADFNLDDETNKTKVKDGSTVIIGGIITSKTIKSTRKSQMMAFITIEDLLGTVEVIVFPRDYEKYKSLLSPDNKVLLKGKATVEEDKNGKLICQSIIPFDKIPSEVWIRFNGKEDFIKNEQSLYEILMDYDGNDSVTIYCECEKAIKHLPRSKNIEASPSLISTLEERYGKDNVKVKQKSIEKYTNIL